MKSEQQRQQQQQQKQRTRFCSTYPFFFKMGGAKTMRSHAENVTLPRSMETFWELGDRHRWNLDGQCHPLLYFDVFFIFLQCFAGAPAHGIEDAKPRSRVFQRERTEGRKGGGAIASEHDVVSQ